LAINAYLAALHSEAGLRGYSFDRSKIGPVRTVEPIVVTLGQLGYEWDHLLGKLSVRNPRLFARLRTQAIRRAIRCFFRAPSGGIMGTARPI
jgi:hypothetical protein